MRLVAVSTGNPQELHTRRYDSRVAAKSQIGGRTTVTGTFARLVWSLIVAAVGAGGLVIIGFIGQPAVAYVAAPGCPAGEVADSEAAGWPCEPGCPEGMLVDGVSGVCVAAPGVPPASLSDAVLVPEPEI